MSKIRQLLIITGLTCAVMFALLPASPALATPKIKPRPTHPHVHSHSRTQFYFGGIFMPAPVIYPRPVPAPSVIEMPAPTVYVEKRELEAGSSTTAYWYFCSSLNTYYPYVAECPEPWLAVVPETVSAQ